MATSLRLLFGYFGAFVFVNNGVPLGVVNSVPQLMLNLHVYLYPVSKCQYYVHVI